MKPGLKKRLLPTLLLTVGIYLIVGCLPDRVPTAPDYVPDDLDRPGIVHRVPLSTSTDVAIGSTITIWFDELMNEATVEENFRSWCTISFDSIEVLAVDPGNPDVAYAAKPIRGIFKSEDGLETWSWFTRYVLRVTITDIIVSPANSNLLYVATADSGIYKSLDGGMTWEQINNGLAELHVEDLVMDPQNDDILFAAMNSTGIYKTEDGGSSWEAKNNGVRTAKGPFHLTFNPLNSRTVYAATIGDFVLKSIDGGDSWIKLRTGLLTFNFSVVAVHPLDTSLVFAGSPAATSGIYKSTDAGENWSWIVTGLPATDMGIQSITLHPQDTSVVFISTTSMIFESTDQGRNWTAVGNLPSNSTVTEHRIDQGIPGRLYAVSPSGVHISGDLGGTWTDKNTLPMDGLYIDGSFAFENWQDTTTVIAPLNATTIDTSVIHPMVYQRALEGWIAGGRQGDPPIETNPEATKLIFTPDDLLPPWTRIHVRIYGSFEEDKETLRDNYGAEDISGNSFEVDQNFTFTTGRN